MYGVNSEHISYRYLPVYDKYLVQNNWSVKEYIQLYYQ